MQHNLKDSINLFTSLFAAVCLIALANYIVSQQPKPQISISKQESALNFNSKALKLTSLGHARLVSSILWVTTIIESDLEHYKKKDTNSWMFLRFKSIADLEPNFYKNYYVGGQYLSVIKDDALGSNALYQQGLEIFPSDFWLRFHAGYNAAFELNDFRLANEYLSPLLDHPHLRQQYPHLIRLIQKIKYASGEIELTDVYNYMLENYKLIEVEAVKEQLKETLYALKSEIDLACLNSGENGNCDRIDFEGVPYILKNNQWQAQRAWKKFELYKKKQHPN